MIDAEGRREPDLGTAERATAFWVTGPERGELRSEALPAVESDPDAADRVRVRTLFGAISRGTESLVWQGAVPESQYRAMRAPFQAGDFPWPVKYGYIAVGRVEAGPEALRGRTVFCLHPHQDRFVVPADAVTPVPESVPAQRAVLAANMETAVNALWDAAPLAGERIAVVGGGVVGCLVARLAADVPGTSVTLVDTRAERRATADALGLAFAHPEVAPGDCDLVVHASGRPAGLVSALACAGLEARIVEMSWYGDQTVSLPLGEAFHSRRLRLLSSQVGRLPDHRLPRWDMARRMRLALDLLADARYDALITGEEAFADLPAAMARVTADPDALCRRIRYPDAGEEGPA